MNIDITEFKICIIITDTTDNEAIRVEIKDLPEFISKLQEIKDKHGPVHTEKE